MGDENKGNHRTQVTLALITLVGGVLTVLIANWDKVFPPTPLLSTPNIEEVAPPPGEAVDGTLLPQTPESSLAQVDTGDSDAVLPPPTISVREEITCTEEQAPSDDPEENQGCSLQEAEVEECQVGDADSDGLVDQWVSPSEGYSVTFGPWENPNCVVGGAAIAGRGWHLYGVGSCGRGGIDVKRCRRVRAIVASRVDINP